MFPKEDEYPPLPVSRPAWPQPPQPKLHKAPGVGVSDFANDYREDGEITDDSGDEDPQVEHDNGRFAPGGPLPSVHAAVKSELFLPSLAPGGPDMTPRPIAGPYQTVAVPPPLENKQSLSVDVFRVVASLEAMELLRRHCQIERERRQQWRAITCNEIFIWWRSIIISLPVPLLPQDRVRIQNGFVDDLMAKIAYILGALHPSETKCGDYVRDKATSYGLELFKCWLKHVTVRQDSHPRARVLIASEQGASPSQPPICVSYASSSTRWCVDSGANRDICREPALFNGRAQPKVLTIGEAGQGHSFQSQAEGPITLHVRGKVLPLFSRTVYADQVHENIMSVTEAVDQGYVVVFNSKGVQLRHPKDVHLRGGPVLSGFRDKNSRLFYFDFPTSLLKGGSTPAPKQPCTAALEVTVQHWTASRPDWTVIPTHRTVLLGHRTVVSGHWTVTLVTCILFPHRFSKAAASILPLNSLAQLIWK